MTQGVSADEMAGAIVYLLASVTLPFTLSPAIATLVVFSMLNVGLEIFCEYTKPDGAETSANL